MLSVNCLPVPTVLDTDIGTDIDDTWALFFILSKPEVFDLRLIQVSSYNTTKRAQIVAMILDSMGRYDIPIAVGRYTGENIMPQYDSVAAAYSLSTFEKKGGKVLYGTEKFSEFMLQSKPSNPHMIVEIAPATSLGDVLQKYPSASHNCYCYAMSGSIYRGYLNSSTPSAESNVRSDVKSSQLMYDAKWLSPLTIAPLDTGIAMQYFGIPYQMLLLANTTSHLSSYMLLREAKVWYFGTISTF
jgi:inosine-uridine nucleoside N-ribohydrolase